MGIKKLLAAIIRRVVTRAVVKNVDKTLRRWKAEYIGRVSPTRCGEMGTPQQKSI